MIHFNNIIGLDSLKQKYKELAKKYHPDLVCLQDNKDFDEFFDSDHGDYLDFNIDLETFNDLARSAILKKLIRDLKCKSIELELKIIQKIK